MNLYKTCCYLNKNEDQKTKFKSFFKDLDDVSFSEMFDGKKYLKDAEDCYYAIQELIDEEKMSKAKSKPKISFYFGNVGVYTLGASLFYELNDPKNFAFCLDKVLEVKSTILKAPRSQFYDELLYGVSGYLFCLLTLQKNFQFENVNIEYKINIETHVFDLVVEIIERGIQNYDKKLTLGKNFKVPEDFHLAYTFHEKSYIGGAHGFFGVMNVLYSAYALNKNFFENAKKEFMDLFLLLTSKSIAYYINIQLPSGNFPSSFGRLKKDEMVQFCHGSPGAIAPLIMASNFYSNDKKFDDVIRNSLNKACENIWKFGLLKKGYGLCHGISGNGYGMLNYFNFTKDVKWLYRSMIFALGKNNNKLMKVIENYEFEDRYVPGKSDNPYSLMMGLSGDIMFILHIFFPEEAKFLKISLVLLLIYFFKRFPGFQI